MKNKNLALLTVLLAMWPLTDCTVDTNDTAGTTTITSPDGNSSITCNTDHYDWLVENFPAESEEGTENLAEAEEESTTTGGEMKSV